jgi:hypothetical protein
MDVKIVSPLVSKVAQSVIKNLPEGGVCLVAYGDDKVFALSYKALEDLIELPREWVLDIIKKIIPTSHHNRYIYFCCYDACLEKVFFFTSGNGDSLYFCKTSDL